MNLPPTVERLLPRYRELVTGTGYVELKRLVDAGEYQAVREAIEREYVETEGDGWYFTTTRMGGDIQIQIDRDRWDTAE